MGNIAYNQASDLFNTVNFSVFWAGVLVFLVLPFSMLLVLNFYKIRIFLFIKKLLIALLFYRILL